MAQIWLERVIKWQKKYQQIMNGRYARFDELNRFFLIAALLFNLFGPWIPWHLGEIISGVLIVLLGYRFFSKKIYPRLNENQKYLQKSANFKKFFKSFSKKNRNLEKKQKIKHTFTLLVLIVVKNCAHLEEKEEYV
ncbi:hypothetical protein D920_02006 [Enterococcus faecalis 13-SD-W-01]|nr:hypothetical protein D920_02006 [Enterococcus faecalis 13-SD-W-01]